MEPRTSSVIVSLMQLPIFHAEWVLWLLLVLSVASLAVVLERWRFFSRRRIDIDTVRRELTERLRQGDVEGASTYLRRFDTLETNVVLAGLGETQDGADSVEDLISGAFRYERAHYERRLGLLATIASNAPFIGLFGTVLGIIRAFNDLASNLNEASSAVMAGIAEALIATAVGLLVAIPAVVAFNVFKAKVNHAVGNGHVLSRTLLARLRAAPHRELAAPGGRQ